MKFVDIRFELNGLSFVWDRAKAERNRRKHHIAFEEAAEVFSIRSSNWSTHRAMKKRAAR